jgi:hypothetical protein
VWKWFQLKWKISTSLLLVWVEAFGYSVTCLAKKASISLYDFAALVKRWLESLMYEGWDSLLGENRLNVTYLVLGPGLRQAKRSINNSQPNEAL